MFLFCFQPNNRIFPCISFLYNYIEFKHAAARTFGEEESRNQQRTIIQIVPYYNSQLLTASQYLPRAAIYRNTAVNPLCPTSLISKSMGNTCYQYLTKSAWLHGSQPAMESSWRPRPSNFYIFK